MTTRKAAAKKAEEGIANAGAHENQAPPKVNQVPQLEKVAMGCEVPVIPPPMMDGEIRADFLNLSQAMTSQANDVTSQVQAITALVNREVGHRMPPHASTMASHLRDFTRMNRPMFFGSKDNEYPQDFLDEDYKILFDMGVTTSENVELVAYQLKDVEKTCILNEGTLGF